MEFDSIKYWRDRYNKGGNSGAGSYGRLAEFKAEIINKFVKEHDIKSVFDYGCGDGNQIGLFDFKGYYGYDISPETIYKNREKYPDKIFMDVYFLTPRYVDMTISMDVIYHLVEDEIFKSYLDNLFLLADKYVIIYSSNGDKLTTSSIHVKDREFLSHVPKEFELIEKIPNRYPYDPNDPINTSISDFYIFKRK